MVAIAIYLSYIADIGMAFGQSEGEPRTRREAILRFVRDHATRKAGLSDLAKTLCLSPTRACHAVKELFGVSFGELLADERVRRARVLLLSTDLTVAEVAEGVGLPDQHHFNRLFKKLAGEPPGQFRKRRGMTSGHRV